MKGRCVVFRADASERIGSGHVMRCLTLADELHRRGAETVFVCRALLEPVRQRILGSGHRLVVLPESFANGLPEAGDELDHAAWLPSGQEGDAAQVIAAIAGTPCDVIVVDHYALDQRWETRVAPHCDLLVVIDDLADRVHDCDLLLDQNLGRGASDYEPYVAPTTPLLIGPQWALLRPDFAKARQERRPKRSDGQLRHLLVSLGGADPDGITLRVLDALQEAALPADCLITVVAGLTSPHVTLLTERLSELPWKGVVLEGVTNMAELIAGSDLAIGAAGGSAWERCAVGLPTILLVMADNQALAAEALSRTGAGVCVTLARLDEDLPGALGKIQQHDRLGQAAAAAAAVTDGEGVVRVADVMETMLPSLITIRPAEPTDEAILLDWANDPVTRGNAFQTAIITPEGHHAWFEARLVRPERHRIFIAQRRPDIAIGQVRFDLAEDSSWEISYVLGPQYRGQGLGARMLDAGMVAIGATLGPVLLKARVKPQNLASLRIFERMDFTRVPSPGQDYVLFEKTIADATTLP